MEGYFRTEVSLDGEVLKVRQLLLRNAAGLYMVIDQGLEIPIGYAVAQAGELPISRASYAEAQASLNGEYQADISALRDAHSGAALAGGPTQAAKQEALAERFNARKAKYIADSAALRALYGA